MSKKCSEYPRLDSEIDANSASNGSHPPATETSTPLSCPSPETSSASRLLDALWRSRDCSHQIGILDRQTNKFKNLPVNGVADAVSQALKLSSVGHEVYFACAEYLTPDSRAAANASGSCGFWLDIDCGEDKAAAGKGYPTVDNADAALTQFCKDAGLPLPTHIVHSGGGLHAVLGR